jgi:hypothetical protein
MRGVRKNSKCLPKSLELVYVAYTCKVQLEVSQQFLDYKDLFYKIVYIDFLRFYVFKIL